ncbi:MAG: hypothetical protein OJF47_000921 [Nitrospira sp.]|nr:MAG: hypothetical protein OJF47_000921 [Nitrospira sp.]
MEDFFRVAACSETLIGDWDLVEDETDVDDVLVVIQPLTSGVPFE